MMHRKWMCDLTTNYTEEQRHDVSTTFACLARFSNTKGPSEQKFCDVNIFQHHAHNLHVRCCEATNRQKPNREFGCKSKPNGEAPGSMWPMATVPRRWRTRYPIHPMSPTVNNVLTCKPTLHARQRHSNCLGAVHLIQHTNHVSR